MLSIGITDTAVEKWEKNQNRPTESNRRRIIEFLGFDPAALNPSTITSLRLAYAESSAASSRPASTRSRNRFLMLLFFELSRARIAHGFQCKEPENAIRVLVGALVLTSLALAR